uniref:Uncharacterized protein LOC111135292 isoform X2 n=1 Tax=Crassostrea virginica TaxID=6565 RepID=A0A8B8EM03_CRAVI|nr:uncharacterized protein LOC111135292 isoform X2 [Crassostrea virginica]
MESCVKPESRNIVGTCRRKRKLEDEEQGESSSMAGSSSMDEECEITSTKSKEDSTKRKSFLRSSLSKECISTSTTEEDNEDSDKSYSSKWQCVDLKNINIFYCDKPQPLEELMQIVKEDLFKKYPNSKDVEKTVQKFTKLTKENMLVSFDLDIIRQERKKSRPVKYLYEKRVHERIESDMEKAKKADSDLEHNDLEVDKRTFVIGDKIVKSTPDLAYCTRQVVVGDNIDDTKTLLFVVEVKVKQIKNVTTNRLEELVDSGVLGQVGSVLFAEAFYSCLFPNSLGIMCMETKLIFVYLIMPEEHIDSIMCCEKPLKTEGKIHFTKPYDMLKAEDRAEVCEFLYWLGCFQNQGRWSLMSTERTQFKD